VKYEGGKIMGAWGIKSKESDAGLNVLGVIIRENLKKKDFRDFDIKEILDFLKSHITDKVNHENRHCENDEEAAYYFNEIFPDRYAEAVLLVSECLTEFLQSGEFVFNTFENAEPTERKIKTFVYSTYDLKNLLPDLRTAIENQKEATEWFEESNAEKWKAHVEDMYTTIENEFKRLE